MTALAHATGRARETVIGRLASAGIRPKRRQGRTELYDLRQALDSIYRPELEALAEKARARPPEKPEVLNLAAEKAKLAHEQARTAELKNLETEGELIRAEDVVKLWTDHITHAKRRLRALPRQMAATVAGFDQRMALEALRRIDEVLHDLASGGAREDAAEDAL